MLRHFYTLDVFTKGKLSGNPLAVVTDCENLDGNLMQKIAAEFNLAETVFVLPPTKSDTTAKLRIFTPKREMPFAGHPTIGTAVLIASLKAQNERFEGDITFEEQIGLVYVKVKYQAGIGEAEFISPKLPNAAKQAGNLDIIAKAISLNLDELGFANHTPCLVESSGNEWLFIPVKSLDVIAKAKINSAYWQEAKNGHDIVGAYLYTDECVDKTSSYHARMFAPDFGIVEDPATGAAVATFPGSLLEYNQLEDKEYTWCIEQGYEMGRPSKINLTVEIDKSLIKKVKISGEAVLFMQGTFNL